MNDVLKNLETKLQEVQKKFNDNETKIADIIEQSKQLQSQFDNCATIREQLRGEYTAYFNLINDLKKETKEPIKDVTEDKKLDKNQNMSEITVEALLSESEKEKVKELIAKNTEEKKEVKKVESKKANKKEQELPDYLKG